jgi:hypothetical protein
LDIGDYFCRDFHLACICFTLLCHGVPQRIRCFLAALKALPDICFFKLKEELVLELPMKGANAYD